MNEERKLKGIKEVGPNKWRIIIPSGKVTRGGFPAYKWVTFHGTQRQAIRERERLFQQREQGKLMSAPSSRMTLEDFLIRQENGQEKGWLSYHTEELAPNTVLSYRRAIEKHIIPAIGHKRLCDINRAMVITFLDDQRRTGNADGHGALRPATIQLIQVVLHAALEHAVLDLEILPSNPAAKLTRRSRREKKVMPQPRERALEVDEIRHLLDVVKAEEPHYYALFHLALHTGFRRGELLGLQWRDLDLSNSRSGIISVNRALNSQGKRLVLGPPKTEESKRTNPLPGESVLVLREYREKQEAAFESVGLTLAPDDFVFCRLHQRDERRRPAPMIPNVVTRIWKRLAAKAGLEHRCMHDARHTYVTRLIDSGVDSSVAQVLAGHSDIGTTRGYTHPNSKMKSDAIRKLEDLLAPANKTNVEVNY